MSDARNPCRPHLAIVIALLAFVEQGTVGAEPPVRPPTTAAGEPRVGVRLASAAEIHFVRQVEPLLARRCVACHGQDPAKTLGGLDLTSHAGWRAGGDSGEALISEREPEQSPLLRAVLRKDDVWSAMPPKENDRLTEAEVATLRQWIAQGAVWPVAERLQELRGFVAKEDVSDGVRVTTSGGLSPDWTNRGYAPADLWAYQPIRPSVRLEIDGLIDAGLAKRELTAAPPANRRTLIRRVSFDLVGLPPGHREIEAFATDPRADDVVLAELVDRLLASPHYGERMAQHWLDVSRYADSAGFANDYERGSAWRYRDYVVRSFNADKPYDRFVVEQIAGDEWAAARPDLPELDRIEATLATGFLRMGPWELTGMEVPRIARQRFLDDVTDLVGQAFLGHMLQCARCHDHKFDPVPTRDYYSLQACFATTQLAEQAVAFLPDEQFDNRGKTADLERRIGDFAAALVRLDTAQIERGRAWLKERDLALEPFDRAVEQARKNEDNLRFGRTYDAARSLLQRQKVPDAEIPPRHIEFTPQEFGAERVARKGIERLRWVEDRYGPFAHTVYSGATPDLKSVNAPLRIPSDRWKGTTEESHILAGGDPFSPTEPVHPGVLSAAVIPTESATRQTLPTEREGRRLALAKWIVSADGPLAARVMVNRVWQWHFGQGLAGNPNNFGATGKKPTHPDLLDALASEFIRSGWSVKAMHRKILLSRAYRRSSSHPDATRLAERDPQGTSYAVFQPRRLSAEELRDAMLAASGELVTTVGGPPIRPEINPEAGLQPRQVMGTFAEAWRPSRTPAERNRRTLYVLRLRGLRDPFVEVFDAPSPELSCEARLTSTVAPQAFSLFNSEAVLLRALALAASVRQSATDDSEAVAQMYLRCLGRKPDDEEKELALAHVAAMRERHKTLRFTRPVRKAEIVRDAVEENTGERFSFVERLDDPASYVPDPHPADASVETRALAELGLVLLNTSEFVYVY